MADQCGFDFILKSTYFKAPAQTIETKSYASELPEGEVWTAKTISTTVIYALIWACAGVHNVLKSLIQTLSLEWNLYTSVDQLTVWENSVGLPDPREGPPPTDICVRRQKVQQRLRKYPIVTIEEFQNRVDETWPDYGIFFATQAVTEQFRYIFRYPFDHDNQGVRARFTIAVYIPWLAIDPDDLANSPLTWENLLSWLREFAPAYISFVPIYLDQSSYCVITDPEAGREVYTTENGTWTIYNVHWKEIDIDGTVINHIDTQEILPSTTSIDRSFTDSATNLISASNNITPIVLL